VGTYERPRIADLIFKPDRVITPATTARTSTSPPSSICSRSATHTGSGPHGLHLGQDKALAKKIIRYHGRPPRPRSWFAEGGEFELGEDLSFPVIVKPCSGGGSVGIDAGPRWCIAGRRCWERAAG